MYETTLEQTCKDASFTQLLINAKALIDFSNEAVLLYHFKDVPAYWRRMMMDAGLLKAMIQLKSILTTAEQQTDFEVLEPQVQAIIGDLDICSVVSGCPGPGRRFLANIIVEELQDWLTNGRCKDQQPKFKKTKLSKDMLPTSERPHVDYPIKRFTEPPSFEWFLKHCDQNVPTPFIISKGAIDHWPAFNEHPWSNMEYLKSIAADRMVPVEIGSQYTDANWSQKMMRFSDFITEHILQQQEKAPAYLAQHDLFYQVPRLERDIIVPDYCYIEPKLNQLYTSHADDVIKNAWFGPKGTVSPLHQDPYHNLLCQIVGSKYVRLISPLQSDLVYPRDGLMTNTSQVSRFGTFFFSLCISH